MNITKIKLENFRNYTNQEISFNKGINVIYGDNAQGKTNILEAVFLCSMGKSFRTNKDKELIKFFIQCFDRPAFHDRICQEGRIEDFDKAIEDTIIALNTGVLRTRDGSILKKSEGKSAVVNPEWREKLDTICDMLVALRKRLRIAKEAGAYSTYGEGEIMYCFYDRDLEMWFDSTREEILKILSAICEDIGVHGLHFHRKQYRW